ncbi:MAG: hypothetical protein ABIR37_01170 [Candidatus Saccharimonadales bacterium]
MLRSRLLSALLLVSVLFASVGPAAAASAKNKGLLISPLKSYAAMDAGTQKSSNFTVANLTEKPITVDLSLKQFSVSDYAYNFKFTEPGNKWLAIQTKSVLLQPSENKKIAYIITVPAASAPGGYYYTLFASANLSTDGLASTVRAASLLYLTVNGKLIQTSKPVRSHMSHFAYKSDIPYSIDVKNTGNVHYFAYFSGHLSGFLMHTTPVGTSHLLLPGTTRHVGATIPAPFLPGIYKARYGYKTDSGATFMNSTYLLFVPPWSVAAVLLLVFALYRVRVHRKKRTIKEG